jgi:hypothetical protein
MALPPLTQPTFLGDRDPMIRDPFAPSTIEPGYIRDSDLGSAFVRYPAAGGRLVEKGIGALMDDPLGLVTGAARGAYDFVRESGDPATFVQNLGLSLGLPIVESGQRLAGGDYGGMSLEEEEEARILDALTVAELIPMVGLGIKGVTGALRRRLRAENPDMTDPEIEAIMAQMEGPGDPGGVDLGPRPAELSLEELPETPLATLEDLRDTYETMDAGELPFQEADYADVDATLDEIFGDENPFGPPDYEEVFPDGDRDYDDQIRLFFGDDEYDPVIAGDDDYDPMAGTALRDYESAVEDRLNLELGRYFGDNDMMTTSDALVGIGEDVVAALDNLGYSATETFTFIENAMVRGGYTPAQRRQLMDELFPPVATEPGQPLDPFRDVADADDIEPVVVRDPYTGDFEELSPNNPYIATLEDTGDIPQAIQWERENAPMDEAEFLEAQATGALQIPEGGAPPGLQALANAVQENMANDPLDPFGPPPGTGPTPMNQLEAMDFSLTGQDTALNSRFEEVVLAPGAPKKFKNKQEFINYLTNNKNGVTNAEVEARGIDLLGDGPIDLDDPDVRRWVFRDPLKVRILDGADVQYKGYFLNNPTDYRETIITLDGSPFDADMIGGGVVGDSQHFGATQYSMGGPELLHMRTGQFDVIDPPTENKGATVAGKTFHVGEIQSQATQDARKYRQARKNMESLENYFVGGADKLSEDLELIGNVIKRKNRLDYLRSQLEAVKIFPHDTKPEELAKLEATVRRVDSGLKDELERIGYDSVDEALEYRDAFIKRMEQIDEKSHNYNTARNSLNYLLSLATDVNVDDLGVGSLYQTDRITNIAVKQALEQAIDSGADFITFNRGDLVHGMTGGKLEGHQKYYDRILPKNVNKLMERLEKEHKVKLPRLEDLKLKTESGPELGKVKGFALTPELKEIFKGTGVSAFREGGQVKMRSGVMALPGNGVVR